MNDTAISTREADTVGATARRVVVGIDGSPASIAALREGARLAADRDDALVAVAAWHMPMGYFGYPNDWYPDRDAKSTLDAAVKAAFGDEVPAGYSQLVCEGQPAPVLIDESRDADFLVVGSRGHGGLAGLMLGSVSQACAEYAKCPVLIVHGDLAATPEPHASRPLEARR